MAIPLKRPADIQNLKKANQIVAKTLNFLKKNIHSGLTLQDINIMGEEFLKNLGARPSFKGLYGFPSAVCTSLNEVIIHGVPNNYKIKDGDILGLDIGSEINGWYGDAAITIGIGKISEDDEKLIACSKDTLMFAIDTIKVGMRFKELSDKIEKFILNKGYVPLYSFCGHGIGRKPHEEPEIPNYLEGKNPKQGPKIKNGMVFCIEPMICQTSGEPDIDKNDKWSVRSVDGLRGSHYEHTVAIINNRAVILSKE
jgi:methionyl aminopeptidase